MEQTNGSSAMRNGALTELSKMHQYFSKVQSKYDEFDRINETLPKMNRVGKKPMLVFGIITLSIALIFTVVAANTHSELAITPCVLFSIIGFGLLGGFIAIEIVRKKRVQNYNNRLIQLSKELMYHYNNYGKCQLGADYTNPRIIEKLYDMVQSGRADTIKEAVNQLLSDMRMNEMAGYAQATAFYAQKAAAGAAASAVFSAANLLKR